MRRGGEHAGWQAAGDMLDAVLQVWSAVLCKWPGPSFSQQHKRTVSMAGWAWAARSEGLAPPDVDRRRRSNPETRGRPYFVSGRGLPASKRQSCGRLRDGRPRLGDNCRGRGNCVRRQSARANSEADSTDAGYGYRGNIEQVITHKIMPASPRGSSDSDRSICNWLAVGWVS